MTLPIILIHGFPFDGALWEPQAAFLRQRQQNVLTPDLAGFGNSPAMAAPPADEASMEHYAEDIHQLIRHNGGRAIVGGLSMGGYIVLALLRAHRQDVAGAMLIDTRAQADTPEARANRLKSIDDVRANGTGTLIASMLPRLLAAQAPESVRETTAAMMRRQSPAAVIAAQGAMSRRRDQTDLLGSLTLPTLIVVGAKDIITPPALAHSMHRHIAGSRLVELPGVGHMTPVEAPQALAQAMADFAAPASTW